MNTLKTSVSSLLWNTFGSDTKHRPTIPLPVESQTKDFMGIFLLQKFLHVNIAKNAVHLCPVLI